MRTQPRFQGKLFWFYLLFYSTARFIIEMYRNDPRGWVIPQVLSTAQAVGVIAIPLAVYMLLRGRPRKFGVM
jgi:phosphatidylglycerol:prolipoprotein diacylglycerol transferase